MPDRCTRELQGQERLDLFCDFLRTAGRWLGNSVFMCSRTRRALR
ncbi:hypothetical protein [Streptomyces sp. NBC_00019]